MLRAQRGHRYRVRRMRVDPAQFGAYPPALLSADLTARGTLAQRQARLALQLAPSIWRGARHNAASNPRAWCQARSLYNRTP